MAGNTTGGLKAKEKNLAKNPNWYADIGRKGGQKTGIKKGFALSGKASEAGKKGGQTSKRAATIYVDYNGEKTTLTEIAKVEGVPYRTVYNWYKGGRYAD